MELGSANKTFRGSEPTWANACVGDNGAPGIIDYASGFAKAANALLDRAIATKGIELPVDILVYPVCFTMRHAIELFLKSVAENLISIGKTRGVPLPPFSHEDSHDLGLIWHYVQSNSFATDERLAVSINGLDEYVRDVATMDASGQVFRYPFDLNSKKHLTDIGIINFIVLKERFNEVERLLLALSQKTEELLDEYRWGTFTKKLSRYQLYQLATELPNRTAWCDASFVSIKLTLMAKYKLSGKDFCRALNLIQKRHEMAACIGMQVAIPGLSLEALMRFFDHWCKVNDLKYVIDPPPPRIVNSDDLHDTLQDHDALQDSAKALASEIRPEEFAAIQALFEFEGEVPVSEAFDLTHSIYRKYVDSHAANPDRYLRALIRMMEKVRAFERILYSLDLLGQAEALEVIFERYGLQSARTRLLERSQWHKRLRA
ncbi:hypothetical protein [Rhodoferax mekongensis]|uniref:Uncharacterized protein n=1 Tax=Rhodoferax mekongensis TaxID=3068341 RepID=A0ABZ0AXY3_9BURK|nr:hypothetical protein [Rhodoferax sp. TBRC 17307]WNO03993.1 hypothetical protein RAN89_13885 [Rhodoferax sp. TBRC 17307]